MKSEQNVKIVLKRKSYLPHLFEGIVWHDGSKLATVQEGHSVQQHISTREYLCKSKDKTLCEGNLEEFGRSPDRILLLKTEINKRLN